jgi:hypothetical protein
VGESEETARMTQKMFQFLKVYLRLQCIHYPRGGGGGTEGVLEGRAVDTGPCRALASAIR